MRIIGINFLNNLPFKQIRGLLLKNDYKSNKQNMLYVMLGTIIILLTFCAVGSGTSDDDKGAVFLISSVISVLIIGVLLGVYYFFFR